VIAELCKYAVSATGAAAAGLRGLGRDLLATALVGVVSALGFEAGAFAESVRGGRVVPLVASIALTGVLGGAAAVWYLKHDSGAGRSWRALTSG
jgi:hypothetical protein